MLGHLNSFQRTMLQWNEQHPYNAVHVVHLAGALDLERLTQAVSFVLREWGVGCWRGDRKEGTYRYEADTAPLQIKLISGSESTPEQLRSEVERQLNAGFILEDRLQPFRFFVVQERETFFLGLVYFHVCADAESILRLIQRIVGVYSNRGSTGKAEPVELYPATKDRVLWHRPGWLWKVLLSIPGQARQMRRAFRPRYRNPSDTTNRFTLFNLGKEDVEALTMTGQRLGVTVHDLLLAGVMKALSGLAPGRSSARRRRRLAVGSIVNIRKDLGQDEQGHAFGLFLGSFVVSHEIPDSLSLGDLATDLRRQTRRIKERRLYLAMPAQLALSRLVLSFFSTERQRQFYQKHYPLWAGITNINLNPRWDRNSQPLGYFRAVSTGPATPMVVSATTMGERMQIGLSYRTTVYTEKEVEQVQTNFIGVVDQLRQRIV